MLQYSNLSTNFILNQFKHINYASNQSQFGFGNILTHNIEFTIDNVQIGLQADVFSREILTNKSTIDFKRFLGSDSQDYQRLITEAYIYSFAKAVYYGTNNISVNNYPKDSYCFPGHALLSRFLSDTVYSFHIGEETSFSLYVNISYDNEDNRLLKQIFCIAPDLEEGLSRINNVFTYRNVRYETVLKGLHQALRKKNEGKTSEQKFYVTTFDDPAIDSFTLNDSNPIVNSALSPKGEKFYFINPVSTVQMKQNESLFIGRALGFNHQGLETFENKYFTCIPRNAYADHLITDEVYAITGLKSQLTSYTYKQLQEYLNVPYVFETGGKLSGDSYGPSEE